MEYVPAVIFFAVFSVIRLQVFFFFLGCMCWFLKESLGISQIICNVAVRLMVTFTVFGNVTSVVCFQWERDALRRQILSHFRQHTIDGSWYSKPGGYNKHEKLRARFNKCDTSDDTFVDANELAACVADVPFALRTTQTSNKLVKFVYFRLVSIIISIISEILYVVFSKVHHFIFLFICLKNS